MARNPNDLDLKHYRLKDRRTITLSEHLCAMLDERVKKEYRPARDIAEEILEAVLEGRWSITKRPPVPKPKFEIVDSRAPQAAVQTCFPLDISVKTIMEYYGLTISQLCRKLHCRVDSVQNILDREETGLFSWVRKGTHRQLSEMWEGIPEDYRNKVWRVDK